MGYVGNAGLFLIDTLFSLYILAVLLRLLFQVLRADFYNPLSQALVIITNPPLLPLRRVIPGLYGIDLAAVVLLVILQCAKNFLIGLLAGFTPGPLGLLLYSVAGLFNLTVWVFIIAIFIRVILSWVSPYGGRQNPVMGLISDLTEPLMRPARQMIPPIGGLDLSPMAVIILLVLTRMLICQPLLDFSCSISPGVYCIGFLLR